MFDEALYPYGRFKINVLLIYSFEPRKEPYNLQRSFLLWIPTSGWEPACESWLRRMVSTISHHLLVLGFYSYNHPHLCHWIPWSRRTKMDSVPFTRSLLYLPYELYLEIASFVCFYCALYPMIDRSRTTNHKTDTFTLWPSLSLSNLPMFEFTDSAHPLQIY